MFLINQSTYFSIDQDNGAWGFHSTDLVFPQRIRRDTGEVIIPSTSHHYRTRRSLHHHNQEEEEHHRGKRSLFTTPEDDQDDPSWWKHKTANYSLTAFGQEFKLHLTPFDAFLAPNYTYQFLGNESRDRRTEDLGVPRHCFYSGYVGDDKTHKAVVSVCSGLVSFFFILMFYSYCMSLVIFKKCFVEMIYSFNISCRNYEAYL